MTSATERRTAANRQNAQASTGPRTRSGKLKVRRNALRHGLAAGLLEKPLPQHRVDAIVDALVGCSSKPAVRDAAASFAVAHLSWMRVEAVRHRIIKRKLRAYRAQGQSKKANGAILLALVMSDAEVTAIDRYERFAFNRRRRTARALSI